MTSVIACSTLSVFCQIKSDKIAVNGSLDTRVEFQEVEIIVRRVDVEYELHSTCRAIVHQLPTLDSCFAHALSNI